MIKTRPVVTTRTFRAVAVAAALVTAEASGPAAPTRRSCPWRR
jgi:hypothetical protein